MTVIRSIDFENITVNDLQVQTHDKVCNPANPKAAFSIVPNPSVANNKSLKVNPKNCDERAELVISPNNGSIINGNRYFFGWGMYVPTNFITPNPGGDTYTIVHQMFYNTGPDDQASGQTLFTCSNIVDGKSKGAPGNEMVLNAAGTEYEYKLQLYTGTDSQGRYIFNCVKFKFPCTKNAWQRFIIEYVPSDNPAIGYFRFRVNGNIIFTKTGAFQPPNKKLGTTKVGAYIGDDGNGERLLYVDRVIVATTLAEVL